MARKYIQGKFTPINADKYVGDSKDIVFRSSWERVFMSWCDNNPSVIKWGSEIHPIPYYSKLDKKMRRYFVDFFIQIKTKEQELKTIMIEIKPRAERIPPKRGKKREDVYLKECYTYQVNQDKWEAATEFAKKHNIEFRVMDEYDLGLKKK